jgi:hypothetical protein
VLVATGVIKEDAAKIAGCCPDSVKVCVRENRPTKKGYFFKEVR